MKTKPLLFLVLIFSFSGTFDSYAQVDVSFLSLSLKNVIDLAIRNSSSAKYAQNSNVRDYWRWQNFKTQFRPQLELEGDLPDYRHTTTPVIQPEGSIEFKQVSSIQGSARVSFSQRIPYTDTYIYAETSLEGVKDYNDSSINFSGIPFSIGFVQPLFAHNNNKWSLKTEPLRYEESQKEYIEDIVGISRNAINRFFNVLEIQTDYKLAESNLQNSEENLKLAESNFALGQISKNDYERIELSVFNARKDLNEAEIGLKNAVFELKSYIGLDQNGDMNKNIELAMPLNLKFYDIDPQKAVEYAMANRKEIPNFERRLLESESQLRRAKRNSGPDITLRGSYGLSESGQEIREVYETPDQRRTVRLSVSIPILDWGRSASEVKMAEAQYELVQYDVKIDRQDFEREVFIKAEQFNLLEEQLENALAADRVAENGYQIALEKFRNGEISINDLNIALQERENGRRDYIRYIEDYWTTFYTLMEVTLYDFELNKKITYENPMLINAMLR